MKLILVVLALGSSLAFSEEYQRYHSRGGSYDVQGPYETHIRYYSGGDHGIEPGPGYLRFQNRWLVTRQYQLDENGMPIAGGNLRSSGQAERNYRVASEVEAEQVLKHEAKKQAEHRTYLREQEGAYRTIVGRTVENEKLRRDNSEDSRRQQRFNQSLIETNRGLSRLLDKYNSEEMSKP